MKRIEYAAVEHGYEDDAEWTVKRESAQADVDYDRRAGLDSYLIERTASYSKWRVAQ